MKLQLLRQAIASDRITIMITMQVRLAALDMVIVIIHRALGMYQNFEYCERKDKVRHV